MSLVALLNNTFSTYHYNKGATFPFDQTGTWAQVIANQPCYVSVKSKDTINNDGSLVQVNTLRIRTEPYTNVPEDIIYLDGKMYDVLSYEDIDGLGLEAVTVVKERDHMTAVEIADIIS